MFTGTKFRKRTIQGGNIIGKTRDEYINEKVLQGMWDPQRDFNEGCLLDYCLYSDTMLPVISLYFQCNFIWFDVNEEYTKAIIRKVVQGKEIDIVLTRKCFVVPKSICE